MVNPIADAHVRATKAPARAKAAPRHPPTKAPATIDGEAEQLVRKAAQQISSILAPITNCWPWGSDRVPGSMHIAEADGLLVDLATTSEQWAANCEGPQRFVPDLLQQSLEELGYAATMLDKDSTGQAGEKVALKLLVHHALEAVRELRAAYLGLPGTWEDLRAQPAFSSMRPFRDRPQPPIRRVEQDTSGDLTVRQYKIVLERVAGHAYDLHGLLNKTCFLGAAESDIAMLKAAELLSGFLAGMADAAIGGEVCGGHEGMQYGNSFLNGGAA